MSDGGKGSAQRPIANRKTFEENWDVIFNANRGGGDLDDYGVSHRKSTRDCGGAQHGGERSTKDKPCK